jgi:hypothetical protein
MTFLRYPRPDVPSIQKNQAKYTTITTDTARRKRAYSTTASKLDLLIWSPVDTTWVPCHSGCSRGYNLDVWYGRKMGGAKRSGKVHHPERSYQTEAHVLIRPENVLTVPHIRHPVSHYLLGSSLAGSYILPLTGPGITLSTHARARIGTFQVVIQPTTTRQTLCVQASRPHETRVGLERRQTMLGSVLVVESKEEGIPRSLWTYWGRYWLCRWRRSNWRRGRDYR